MVYHQPYQFYCGVDLHARSMFNHVLDHNMQPSAGATTDGVSIPRGPASVRPLPFGDRAVDFE